MEDLWKEVQIVVHRERGEKGRVTRVSQNHVCTVYTQYFWQGNHQIYGHI
jgi:hypothetical protein